jgi:hypothetical protein
MAKFRVSSYVIKPIMQGTNKGNDVVIAKLQQADDIYNDQERTMNVFSKPAIEIYKAHTTVTNGGIAAEISPLPEEVAIVHGRLCEWKPADGSKFMKRHLSDGAFKNGASPWKAGDIVKDQNGIPHVYDSLLVFCRQYWDEDTKQWTDAARNDAKTIGLNEYNSYCVPLQISAAKEEEDDESNNINPTPPVNPPINNQGNNQGYNNNQGRFNNNSGRG